MKVMKACRDLFGMDLRAAREGLERLQPPDVVGRLNMLVENVDDWHAHVLAADVVARFGVQVGDPEDRPWAMRDFTLFDPSGVLWRVAQNMPGRAGT